MAPKNRPLYLITDGGKLRKEKKLTTKLKRIIVSGHDLIGYLQLREQNIQAALNANTAVATNEELLVLAFELKQVCSDYGVRLIVNRNIEIAREVKADGLHLGIEDNISEIRNALGENDIIGCSAHRLAEIEFLNKEKINYCFFSPVFSPLSKKPQIEPHGLEVLAKAVSNSAHEVFALGGITPENISSCLNSGAKGVALISSVILADNPEAELSRFRVILEK